MNFTGKLLKIETQTGMSQSGKEWTRWIYSFDTGLQYPAKISDFKDWQPHIGKTYTVEYDTKPNPSIPNNPFKNITNMTESTGVPVQQQQTITQSPIIQPQEKGITEQFIRETLALVKQVAPPGTAMGESIAVGSVFRTWAAQRDPSFKPKIDRIIQIYNNG